METRLLFAGSFRIIWFKLCLLMFVLVITSRYEEKATSINYGLATNISKNITMTLTWNATTWKNSMYGKNLKYFKVELRDQGKQFPKYVNAASNVSRQT